MPHGSDGFSTGKSVRFAPPPSSSEGKINGARFNTPVYPVRDISGYLRQSDSFRYMRMHLDDVWNV